MLVASAATIMRCPLSLHSNIDASDTKAFADLEQARRAYAGSLLWGTASTIIQRNDTPMRWFLRHTMLQE
jgi:hypothetical protein